MVKMRRTWKLSRLLCHILTGFILLVLTGALWFPYNPLIRKCMRWWLAKITDILNIEVELRGELPHEKDGAVLLIANHVSWIDVPVIGGQTPISFLAKTEIASWPLIGTLATRVGTLFIQRGSGDTELVSKTMAHTLKKNRSVLFFPEGTTSDGKGLKRFHRKLFQVCQHHDVTIQPLVLHYRSELDENPVPFLDDEEFVPHLWNIMGHKRLYAYVEALPAQTLDSERWPEQVGQIKRHMHETLQRRKRLQVVTAPELDAPLIV